MKDPSQFTTVGKPELHRDGRAKVTGKAHYAGDIRLPGMLYAKILRPPAHGAKLKSVDTAAAKKVPGVQVVQDGDLIAVLHEFPDVAEAALAQIKAEFDVPEAKWMTKPSLIICSALRPPPVFWPSAAIWTQAKNWPSRKLKRPISTATSRMPPMETHTASGPNRRREGHGLGFDAKSVWRAGPKLPGRSDFPAEKVRVITPFVGGGFGGKTNNHEAVEAARLAKAAGKPVQVMWSREEEFFYDTFRPAAIVKINSGVDASGKMAFWDYDVYFAGERGAEQFYTVPNHRTASRGRASAGRRARIRLPPARGARPATTPIPSPANRRLT